MCKKHTTRVPGQRAQVHRYRVWVDFPHASCRKLTSREASLYATTNVLQFLMQAHAVVACGIALACSTSSVAIQS